MKHGAINMIPKAKGKSLRWKTTDIPTTQKARVSKSQMKTMLITFFYIKDTVQFEFIPQGQTVNEAYFVEIL
jgi:hypothetical protein